MKTLELGACKCPRCSSQLVWSPQKKKLNCGACDYMQAIESDTVTADSGEVEVTLQSLDQAVTSSLQVHAGQTQCSGCGSKVMVADGELGSECGFCGSALELIPDTDSGTVMPANVVPIAIDKKTALQSAVEWSKKQFLAPFGFAKKVKEIKLKPIYVPIWAFDYAASVSFWYDVDRTEGEGDDEKTVTDTFSGSCFTNVDEVAVYGATGYMEWVVVDAFPYPAEMYRSFDAGYFQGASVELNSMGLGDAIKSFHDKLEVQVHTDMSRGSGAGAYNFKIRDIDVSKKTWKHMYVPMYLGGYRLGLKYYPLVVNAATGEVSGRAPLSIWKLFVPAVLSFNLVFIIISIVAAFGSSSKPMKILKDSYFYFFRNLF